MVGLLVPHQTGEGREYGKTTTEMMGAIGATRFKKANLAIAGSHGRESKELACATDACQTLR